jgi:hypothetical protein
VDEIAAWLADHPRAGDRIRHRAPGQPAEFAPLDVHPRVERAAVSGAVRVKPRSAGYGWWMVSEEGSIIACGDE